MYGAKIKINIY